MSLLGQFYPLWQLSGSGQIDSPGEQGKSIYSNLSFQTLNALAQDFTEREIINTVRRATTGGLPFRTVL